MVIYHYRVAGFAEIRFHLHACALGKPSMNQCAALESRLVQQGRMQQYDIVRMLDTA